MAYKYFTFISYRHTDIKEAKRLQGLLETYSLPTALQKVKPDAPKHFHVFRDTDELTSGELTEELHKKLDESKWLVVICSPDSAQSEYVGQEIAYFRNKGRSKEIIPFIIKGTPHAKENECFHPQLTLGGLELLGIDVQAEQSQFWRIRFHRAFIRLVAKMLDLSFDDLWQRRVRYMRRLRCMQIAILAVIIGTIAYAMSSRPFDMKVNLQTAITKLPLSADATDSLYLYLGDDDVRTMPISSLDEPISFPNIPGKYKGERIRVRSKAFGFVDKDTTIALGENVELPLTRDVEIYGRIRYKLVDNSSEQPLANATIDFGFMKASTDGNGIIDVLVPLERQQKEYVVKIDCKGKSMRMTYGEKGNMLTPTQSEDTNMIYVEH